MKLPPGRGWLVASRQRYLGTGVGMFCILGDFLKVRRRGFAASLASLGDKNGPALT